MLKMKKVFYTLILLVVWGYGATLMAQPQFFKVQITNVGQPYDYLSSGAFAVPVDSANPGPLLPGAAYEFSFYATPGSKLTFATMFVQSNDLFLAPDEEGIDLFDDMGNPLAGELADQLQLWDPGTEINESPGEGQNQAPRQAGPDTGQADPDSTVRLVDDGFQYPGILETLSAMLMAEDGGRFTLRLENIAGDSALQVSDSTFAPVIFSPGVFVVHAEPAPLFTVGERDRSLGLEAVAEDGAPGALADALAKNTGATPILSPGIYAVHEDADPFFTVGEPDRAMGLEAIAEDGNPGMLAGALRDAPDLTAGAFAIPVGADMPGPILPGGSYEFVIASGPQGRLSLTTMFVQSNDLFYAPGGHGIALFDIEGNPIDGDVSSEVTLWDAGTEANEFPGVGANQAPRQVAANSGAIDTNNLIRLVEDGFSYPADTSVIKVAITPLSAIDFTVRIENVSSGNTQPINETDSVAVPLSPGVWVLHSLEAPFFDEGSLDRGLGLEGIAEDGDPAVLGSYLSGKMGTPSGIFNTPIDSTGPGPLFPGASYEFNLRAAPGMYLNLATMFVQSNDLFYAPDGFGIPLFDVDGQAISGDVSDQFLLWDAGTELNEQPGVGPNQAPRQMGANTGEADPDSLVRIASDDFIYPMNEDVIKVTINPVDSMTTTIAEVHLGDGREASLRVFPNPLGESSSIEVHLSDADLLGLELYDLAGRRIKSVLPLQLLKAGNHQIPFSAVDLRAGLYFLAARNSNGIVGGTTVLRL